jgi:hyperosmotically inducible periplasmic protein
MKVFVGILLGIAIAVMALWFMGRDGRTRDDVRDELSEVGQEIREGAEDVAGRIREGVDDIDTDRIQENVREGGRRIADSSADALVTGKVKAQFAIDSEVSAMRIAVDTTDGMVTLSGRASSQAEIDRAVDLARRVEGVREVVSTIQVGDPRE